MNKRRNSTNVSPYWFVFCGGKQLSLNYGVMFGKEEFLCSLFAIKHEINTFSSVLLLICIHFPDMYGSKQMNICKCSHLQIRCSLMQLGQMFSYVKLLKELLLALACPFRRPWLREDFWLEQASCQGPEDFSAMSEVALDLVLQVLCCHIQ